MWDNYQEVYTMSASILIDGAIRDGNLVTDPAWPAHPAWLKEFAAMLEDQVRMTG
jgi:protease I